MMRPYSTVPLVAVFLLAFVGSAFAHVGSPGVLHEGNAGPYPLIISISPPYAIPGVAHADIRSTSSELASLQIVATPIGADSHAPRPDQARRSSEDSRFYTADIWIMTPGTWKVRIVGSGALGNGELSLPIPGLPSETQDMGAGLAAVLGLLGALLAAGAVSIVGAAIREAALPSHEPISSRERKRARVGMASASVVIVALLALGATAWSHTAERYASIVYRPLSMTAWLDDQGKLFLRLRDPGWLASRRLDDLMPDHDHLMHLFMVRTPGLDAIGHLHPEQLEDGLFVRTLPAVPQGSYRLFADVVHRSGLSETAVADIQLPDVAGGPPIGDDAWATAPQSNAPPGANADPGDGNIEWAQSPDPIRPNRPTELRFRIEKSPGVAADDMELYMGMLGHMAVVRRDLGVFAHVHPTGTVPMAALAIAEASGRERPAETTNATGALPALADRGAPDPMEGMHHGMHDHRAMLANSAGPPSSLPAEVVFPYAFPSEGSYRMFVQVKRGGKVRTRSFDLSIVAP